MTDTFERLCALLIRTHRLSPDQLTPDAALEGLGIDSLGTVELLWDIEDSFDIKLPSSEVALTTLADVVRYVDELVASQKSQAQSEPLESPALRLP